MAADKAAWERLVTGLLRTPGADGWTDRRTDGGAEAGSGTTQTQTGLLIVSAVPSVRAWREPLRQIAFSGRRYCVGERKRGGGGGERDEKNRRIVCFFRLPVLH